MDPIEGLANSTDANRRGKNQMWDNDMDRTLCEYLDAQVADGNKVQNGFKDSTYVHAAQVVNQRHGLNINKENIRNRVKSMKKVFRTLRAIIYTSGFGWNPEIKQLAEHEDSVWNSYVSEHPEAKHFRNRKFEFYEIWENIFGEDTATGQWARTQGAPSNNQSQSHVGTEASMENDEGVFESGVNMGSAESQQNFPTSQFPRSSPHGEGSSHVIRSTPRSKNQRQGIYSRQLDTIAESIKAMANALQQEPNPYLTDLSPILRAIKEIPNISEDMVVYAMEYLSADPVRANVFMTFDISQRTSYLLRHWRSHNPDG